MASKHHLNIEAFAEPLSAEARYWVGFLLADGYISKGRIGLSLAFKDIEHVKKFARFVGILEESVREYSYSGNFGKSHSAQLCFTGKGLIPQLAKYGVMPRKTYVASVPPALAHDPDFWRGLIDGDGSVGKTGSYNQVQFSGTLALVEGFRNICHRVVDFLPCCTPNGSIFQSALAGIKATKLLTWLYYPGAVALERKARAWTHQIQTN